MAWRGAVSRAIQTPAIMALDKVRRVTRTPQHTWYVKQIPYTIQPVAIAPVLPGESLVNATYQARAVTDPVLNPLCGWWLEYYCFYVKLRDLDDRDTFSNAMIDPGTALSSIAETDDTVSQYFNPGTNSSINYVEKCLKRVTEDYFRRLDETWNNITINGLPVCAVAGDHFIDSFINDDSFQTSIEPTVDTSGASVGISVIEQAMQQWELLKQDNMTDLTFEDWCRAFGVNIPAAETPHRPELLRYTRLWQYPSNTINPSTGAPTSAVSWVVNERVDKRRFFTEPGFIFVCSTIRAKTYFGTQSEPAVNFFDDQKAWQSPFLSDDPSATLRQFTAGTGPFKSNTDDYWYDHKDVFLHGDQFINVAPATTGQNMLTLPTAGGVWRYPTNQAMLDLLFVTANATVKQDGVLKLHILGKLRETS